jgi:hypothetical protein
MGHAADGVDMASFTATNAREMAARSHEARRQRQSERDNAPALPELDEDYVGQRLARVRAQLDRVDQMMMKEPVAQKLDRLASAQARLSEQERKLDGRPLPGSLKPKPQKLPPRPSPFAE